MKQVNPDILTTRSLTTGEANGSGMFEELMRTVESHIDKQRAAGNITPRNFDQIYLGALQYTLAESSKFVLSYQEANQRNQLIEAQVEGQKYDNDYKKAQITHINKQIEMLDKQMKLADAELLQAAQNLENSKTQGQLLAKQVLLADKEIALKDVQKAQVIEQTKLITQQTANALTENTTMIKQQAKLDSEKDILDQKLVTETAQTSDTVGGHVVGGVVGKQITLYERQADGYLRDAEQKAAKFYTDMMATRVSTSEDTYDLSTAKMQNEQVAQVLDKVRQGIGMSPAS